MSGSSWLLLLGVLGFVAALRIGELVLARLRTKAAEQRGARPQREPIFVVMVVLHVLPFVLTPAEVLWLDRPFVPWLAGVSCAALAVLLVLRVWTLSTLGAAWNVRIVRPDDVVVRGPYRFVRHPNYAIVIGELLFLPLVHTAVFTCVALSVLNALVLAVRIPAEERVLDEVPGYRAAMAGKPRFLPAPSTLAATLLRRA